MVLMTLSVWIRPLPRSTRSDNLGDWFYRQVVEWSKSSPNGHATTHIFRKTSLQQARRGEDINRLVAQDARLTESVMTTNYVREGDSELRHNSNRTYQRLLNSVSTEIAKRYGYDPSKREQLEEKIEMAVSGKKWELANELIEQLRHLPPNSPNS